MAQTQSFRKISFGKINFGSWDRRSSTAEAQFIGNTVLVMRPWGPTSDRVQQLGVNLNQQDGTMGKQDDERTGKGPGFHLRWPRLRKPKESQEQKEKDADGSAMESSCQEQNSDFDPIKKALRRLNLSAQRLYETKGVLEGTIKPKNWMEEKTNDSKNCRNVSHRSIEENFFRSYSVRSWPYILLHY